MNHDTWGQQPAPVSYRSPPQPCELPFPSSDILAALTPLPLLSTAPADTQLGYRGVVVLAPC